MSGAWRPDVAALFSAPYWIEASRRAGVAGGWLSCMNGYGIDLSDYESVRGSAETVYEHLASRSMPLTDDTTQQWPVAALTLLKAWIDAGCPREGDVPPGPPAPPRPAVERVRRNILDLTERELADYRAAVEDLGAARQHGEYARIALLHTDWCLHYQEAFLPWHRANLLYFEHRLGMAVPYWNFMSPDAPVDGKPGAGLPQPFKDESYVHPRTGEERPNPLRHARAYHGQSKAGGSAYVQRDPVLYTSGDEQRAERAAKLELIAHYQAQVDFALGWPRFSAPEGAPGYPWANITSFDPPPPDSDYPHRTDFDGLFEQPHDNFHGWVGPDMADNAYTAFDPVFWSYHANVDRLFEQWLRAHPAATFTSGFPLRPFVGADASGIDPTAPDSWGYTTIGDLARDSRALGYDFVPPAVPDAAGRPPVLASSPPQEHLYVLFAGVRCLRDTYTIDVFAGLSAPTPADLSGPHYVGRMTRLGMGVEDDKGRCVAAGVTRVLDASHNAHELGLAAGEPVAVGLIVRDATGRIVPAPEYSELPGFAPVAAWGDAMPIPNERKSHGCSHPH